MPWLSRSGGTPLPPVRFASQGMKKAGVSPSAKPSPKGALAGVRP